MKKIISLMICLLVLFSFCMPTFADDNNNLFAFAVECIGNAERELNRNEYSSAALQYTFAARSFEILDGHVGGELAWYLYGMAADLYEKDLDEREARGLGRGDDYDARSARENQENNAKYVGADGCLRISDYFNSDGKYIGGAVGSTLSEGNIAIIAGVASAVVFGIGGLVAGKALEKKKYTQAK